VKKQIVAVFISHIGARPGLRAHVAAQAGGGLRAARRRAAQTSLRCGIPSPPAARAHAGMYVNSRRHYIDT